MSYSNYTSISHRLAVIAAQKIFSYLLSLGPNFDQQSWRGLKIHTTRNEWHLHEHKQAARAGHLKMWPMLSTSQRHLNGGRLSGIGHWQILYS